MANKAVAPPPPIMLLRHHAINFASGALVFPGGRVDDNDRALAADTIRNSPSATRQHHKK